MTWTLSGFADEAGDAIDVQIDTIEQAGFNYIDLRGLDGFNIADLPLDHAQQVASKLNDANIKVGMFGTPLGKIDIADDMQIDLTKLEHLGKLADVFDCRDIRVFSYFNEKGATPEEWKTESLSRLGQLRDLAEKLNLVLYHENERDIFGDVCDNVLAIADALYTGNDGAFRLIFDFDNYNQCDEDVWENWLKLRDRTEAFHLKDSDKQRQHVPIGAGAGYAKEIFVDCLERGWTGHLALEPHLAHSPAVMATGPGGVANQALADMTDFEAWQVGATTAKELLNGIGAQFS